MRIIPVLPTVNLYNYSPKRYNNDNSKIKYADTVTFGSAKLQKDKMTTIPNVNLTDVMADGGVLSDRLHELLKSEKELRKNADTTFGVALERIRGILTDNGVTVEEYSTDNFDKPELKRQLSSLIYKHKPEHHKKEWIFGSEQPFRVATIKSEQYPDAELKIFETPARDSNDNIIDNRYAYGIVSYKDSEITLTNKAYDSNERLRSTHSLNYLTLNTSELRTKGWFDDLFGVPRHMGSPIYDKKEKVEIEYMPDGYNSVKSIKEDNENIVYNVIEGGYATPNIVQRFPEKNMQVTYELSNGTVSAVSFSKID